MTRLGSTRYYLPFSSSLGAQALLQTQYLLDTATFTLNGQVFVAESPISHFKRALEDLPAQKEQSISWTLTGSVDNAGQRWLDVSLSGFVVLDCQRCLQEFDYHIDTENRVLVVDNELELEVDAEDPDAPERILSSTHLNALDLVEDELILSLPYVPRHDKCPELPEALQSQDEEAEDEKPNPFAVLSQLKKS